MTIGDRIKSERERLGISQTELANCISVSKQTLYKYENNIITNIPSDNIEKLSKIFDTSPAYIMGWEDAITNEMKNISDRTNLFIKIFQRIGYKILLQDTEVEVINPNKQKYRIPRKDFMSMIQRCFKDLSWNMDKLLSEFEEVITPPDPFILKAAHGRTDIVVTDEMRKHDDAIMNDENF